MKDKRQKYEFFDALENQDVHEWNDLTLNEALGEARDWLYYSPFSEGDIYMENRWFVMDEEGNETDVRGEWRSE